MLAICYNLLSMLFAQYWSNKHFEVNSECISELVQNILHFHFTKKKIEVYYFEEIGNIPLCYLCYQI